MIPAPTQRAATGATSALRPLELEVILALSAGAVMLLVMHPFAAFALATLLLLNLPSYTPRCARLTLATVAAVAFAMMTGARPLDPDGSNDIDGYYDIYLALAGGDLSYLTQFGGGFEVAVPTLFYVWGLLLPPVTVNGLMFCLALTGSLLMMIWVEKTFYVEGGLKRPALMGVCLLMLNLYFSTQLSRQFLSLIVLLFAFSAQGRLKQLAYLGVASAFHITAIPFFGIYLLAKRGPAGWLVMLALAIALRLYFVQLLTALDIVPEAVGEKLVYYVDNLEESTGSDLGSLRMIFLLGLISVVGLVMSGFRPDPKSKRWLVVAWMTGVVHVALLPIPLASLRTTLMVHSVVPGLIAYKMLEGRAHRALPVVLNILFVYKIATFATAAQSGNLLSTLSMLDGFLK